MDHRSRRATATSAPLAAVTLVGGDGASAAVVAKPLSGTRIGSNRTEFEVSATNRCGPVTVPVAKVTIYAGGRFKLDQRISKQTGRKLRVRVSGQFTSAFDVHGTVACSQCKATFVARASAAPEPAPAPAPYLSPDPVTPE